MNIQLKTQLYRSYGFQITEITPAPRGFVGETYFVTCLNHSQYFVKILKGDKFTTLIDQSTQIQNWLSHQVDFVQPVISNLSNELISNFGKSVITVYPKINLSANSVSKLDNDILKSKLQHLHDLNLSNLKIKAKEEDFEPYFEKVYDQLISQIYQAQTCEVEKQFQEYLSTKLTLINQLHSEWILIKQKCQDQTKTNFVLTHGDVLGNTLIDENGKLSIIDWDDIILAPKERDFWMFDGIGQSTDKLYYSYYLYLRFFDDLTDWLNSIFESDLPQTEKAKQLKNCKKDCFED